jgi:hypothetical protein
MRPKRLAALLFPVLVVVLALPLPRRLGHRIARKAELPGLRVIIDREFRAVD